MNKEIRQFKSSSVFHKGCIIFDPVPEKVFKAFSCPAFGYSQCLKFSFVNAQRNLR